MSTEQNYAPRDSYATPTSQTVNSDLQTAQNPAQPSPRPDDQRPLPANSITLELSLRTGAVGSSQTMLMFFALSENKASLMATLLQEQAAGNYDSAVHTWDSILGIEDLLSRLTEKALYAAESNINRAEQLEKPDYYANRMQSREERQDSAIADYIKRYVA